MYQTYDELFGTEDCLYINVYTPTVSSLATPERRRRVCGGNSTCRFRAPTDPWEWRNTTVTGYGLDRRWRLQCGLRRSELVRAALFVGQGRRRRVVQLQDRAAR